MSGDLLFPQRLRKGDTIGIFTPSVPAYQHNLGLFENGIRNLQRMGFSIKLGTLTAAHAAQGYRSGSGQERAAEFMSLIEDPKVRGLISTIGGYNSSSMLPFLDYPRIASAQKVICGYSDVTSLHMAIHKKSRLQTFYGPAVMTWFGEWPDGVVESTDWFLDAVMEERNGPREIKPPTHWSCHRRSWDNGDWKNVEREWQSNDGWRVLTPGSVTAPILALNMNTMLCLAGTEFWPDVRGHILLLEEMDAPLAKEERCLMQLSLIGVFKDIAGLIVSKPEVHNPSDAPFTYDDLISEVVGHVTYPIVTNFDCGHTIPMVTIPQGAMVELNAPAAGRVSFRFV
jgi:muramoyltetrapeptide carboxypeptidase LdcA involved in peptidoglycan recycling